MSFLRGGLVGLLIVCLLGAGCSKAQQDQNGKQNASDDGNAAVDRSRPVQPLSRHPRVTLSNLRFGKSFDGEQTLSVDWKLPSGKEGSQWTLIIKPASASNRMEVTEWFSGQSGTFRAKTVSFGRPGSGPSLKSGCEVYLVSKEGDLEFKISNSLTTGNAAVTEARSATDEELAKLERDLKAEPPEAAGFVSVPEGVILPSGTLVKVRIGRSRVEATVVSHDSVSGIARVKRKDISREMVTSGTDLLIDPKVLESVKKKQGKTSSSRPTAGKKSSSKPPGETGLVPVPEGVTLPPGTSVVFRLGRRRVEARVVSHKPGSQFVQIKRKDFPRPTNSPRRLLLIDPKVLESVQKKQGRKGSSD